MSSRTFPESIARVLGPMTPYTVTLPDGRRIQWSGSNYLSVPVVPAYHYCGQFCEDIYRGSDGRKIEHVAHCGHCDHFSGVGL